VDDQDEGRRRIRQALEALAGLGARKQAQVANLIARLRSEVQKA
jgi:hypothetical protein